jgi:endo-1,4-beta-xylanase
MNEKYSRRDFLKLTGIMTVFFTSILLLSACVSIDSKISPLVQPVLTKTASLPTSEKVTLSTIFPVATAKLLETPAIVIPPTLQPQSLDQWAQTSKPESTLINQVVDSYAKNMGISADDVQIAVEIRAGINGSFAVLVDKTKEIPLFVSEMDSKGEPVWQVATIKNMAEKTGIKFGSEGLDGGNDPEKFKIIKDQFDQMTITGLSWRRSQPGESESDFTISQGYLQKALINNQIPTFQHLVYGNSSDTPDWLTNGHFTREQAIKIMQDHITNVMESNRSYVQKLITDGSISRTEIKLQYVVVNEGVNEPSYYWPQKIGPEYIDLAFQAARAADPDAVLLYNDYKHELPNLSKANPVFNLVKHLKNENLIDGVGMQMHFTGGPDGLNPNLSIQELEKGIQAQIDRYEKIGVKVHITELDVDLSKITGTMDDKMQKASAIYRMISKICAGSSNCREVTVFGVNSENSGISDQGGKPTLLFSKNQPLPTFYAALGGLLDATMFVQ